MPPEDQQQQHFNLSLGPARLTALYYIFFYILQKNMFIFVSKNDLIGVFHFVSKKQNTSRLTVWILVCGQC